MKFPSERVSSIEAYYDQYVAAFAAATQTLDKAELLKAADLLDKTVKGKGIVYACGNGGSAAIANHLQCDFLKGIATDTAVRPKVHSLASEISTITAIGNDIGYDDVFAYQLRDRMTPDDLLIAVSSSGNSPNILRALEVASKVGAPSIAMTGFSGGEAKGMATACLYFAVNNYGVAEDLHQMTMHLLAQFVRMKNLSGDADVPSLRF